MSAHKASKLGNTVKTNTNEIKVDFDKWEN